MMHLLIVESSTMYLIIADASSMMHLVIVDALWMHLLHSLLTYTINSRSIDDVSTNIQYNDYNISTNSQIIVDASST